MAANYQVSVHNVVDGSLELILDTTAIYNLRYSRIVNDVGKIVLELPYSAYYESLFALDTFLEVYRTDPTNALSLIKEGTYFIRLFERMENESNEERYMLGGVSLEHLLFRRQIDYRDDPLGAGGLFYQSGCGR